MTQLVQPIHIDGPLVTKILNLIDHGLVKGIGQPQAGQMCVEAVICYALGQEHGDQPQCVGPAVRQFKIKLNDAHWSSDLARAKGLRRVAIAQLGSAGIDEKRFVAIITEQTIRQIVPIALRAAAKRLPAHRESLLAAALRCETEGTKEAAENARNAAAAAAADAANTADAAAYAAYAAADAAAYAAAADAAYAAYAAYAANADAANAAAYAAAADAAAANAAAKRDAILTLSAEIAVEALRECGSPGVEFMPERQAA